MHRAPIRLVLGLAAVGCGAVVLGGCASSAAHKPATVQAPAPPPPVAPLASAVLPGEAIVSYQASAHGTLAFERFEFSRNNAELNVVRDVPIEAGRQWPEPPRPRERPIIFWRWRQ